MGSQHTRALSDVLDQLEASAGENGISVEDTVRHLGHRSFASLMLIMSLIAASPASAIPGLTAFTAATVFLLVIQMIAGRDCLWLPGFIARRKMKTKTMCRALGWLRGPVEFTERFLKPRLTFLLHRPWSLVPLVMILALTLVMPFLELIPTTGSIASGVIAFFAAGLLARDGLLILVSLALLLGLPLAVWHFGFSGT